MESSDLAPVSWAEREFFRRMNWRADRWAIASESRRALEIFAHLASDGTLSFYELVEAVEQRRTESVDPQWLARLGRVVAVRPVDERLARFGLDALRLGVPEVEKLPATMPVRTLLFELLLWEQEPQEARRLLESDTALQELYFGYMEADLANPRVDPSRSSIDAWWELLNKPLAHCGLAGITPDPGAEVPFDTLNSMTVPPLFSDPRRDPEDSLPGREALLRDNPLVSVIVTTFNPDPVELRTSVRSMLRQTWQNLEILLVDDASSEIDPELLDSLSAEDSRVRVVRQKHNGGTYLARNAGIRVARGLYVTGQDTDDWSHPQRIERELLALYGNPGASGVMVMANRTDDRLVRTAVGFVPQRRCEVSLMLRTEDARAVGGYVPMRKGADSEFRERLVQETGRRVIELQDPLYVTRLSPGSLSRADFRHGWTAPARLAFSSAYRYWHSNAAQLLPPLDAGSHGDVPPFGAPGRISGVARPEGERFDVCVVADWRSFGPTERAAVDEIGALIDADLSVAVLQLDSPYSDAVSARLLQPQLQEWINSGQVAQLMPDEHVVADLVIVREPSVVEYARMTRLGIDAGRVLVVADNTRSGDPVLGSTFRVPGVDAAIGVLFARSAQWIAPEVADPGLTGSLEGHSTLPVACPTTVRSFEWRARPARSLRADVVIGRPAQNLESDWPTSVEDLMTAYPVDHGPQVRIHGDARGGIRVLGERRMPVNWVDFRSSEVSAPVFWATVDVAALFAQREPNAGTVRALAEAMASGVPVICDHGYRDVFGAAAYYARPDEAPEAIARVLDEASLREQLIGAGFALVRERWCGKRYAEFVAQLIQQTAEVDTA